MPTFGLCCQFGHISRLSSLIKSSQIGQDNLPNLATLLTAKMIPRDVLFLEENYPQISANIVSLSNESI